ncbi:MAG: S9 family peptidase [Caulobacter sp.]|nr:S9 family peptidase [Caulobacter sp.]
MAAAATAPLAFEHAFAAEAVPPVPPTIDELLKESEVLDSALSPDGGRAAVLVSKTVDGKVVSQIDFYETGTSAANKPVSLGELVVEQVEWASNDRLLVWIRMDKGVDGKPTGRWFYDEFVPIPVRRIVSVNADGQDATVLFNNQKGLTNRQFNLSNVVDRMNDDPRNILMQLWDTNTEAQVLYRVDVYSGEAVLVERGRQATDGWFTQSGVPVIRYDSNPRGTTVTIYVRAPGETEWKMFRKVRRNELQQLADLEFVAPTPDPGVILMLSMDEGADMPSVRKFDTRTMQIGELVAEDKVRPIRGVFTDENDTAMGVSLSDDRTNYTFFDPKLRAHYKGLNTYFGGECSVRPFDVSRDHKRFIFDVSGPRQPGAFWLYDVEKKRLELLGEKRPWLTEERLAPMRALSVNTRDGKTITAYLTTPITPASGRRPMVVLPHGGPEVRDSLDFDLFAQAFAAKGWLVLQPNFRGSGGYGKAFADQGRRHWGDLMQEDVEDSVDHVIAAGLADPARIAICGASYGGYAAMMGAVRKPDLYKAVVSIAGDADLDETLAFSRQEDGADSRTYAYWVETIGDPKVDKAMLAKASPALRAAEFKAPVLLIHGTEDTIVTPKQSRIMAKALKAAGKPCELVEMKGVGHRDWTNANWKMILEKSVTHIQKAFA